MALGGNFFDWFTAFKVFWVFEIFEGDTFGGDEGRDECVVLFLVERTVEIVVAFAFVIARLGEDDVAVEGGSVYGRRDCIVEIEVVLAGLLGQPLPEVLAGQGAGGKDKRFTVGEDFFGHLGGEEFATDGDVGVLLDLSSDGGGEVVAIHTEGGATGNRVSFGGGNEEGAKGSHFRFELSGGSGWILGFEAV